MREHAPRRHMTWNQSCQEQLDGFRESYSKMYDISFHKIHIVIQYTAGAYCKTTIEKKTISCNSYRSFYLLPPWRSTPPARETAQDDTYQAARCFSIAAYRDPWPYLRPICHSHLCSHAIIHPRTKPDPTPHSFLLPCILFTNNTLPTFLLAFKVN